MITVKGGWKGGWQIWYYDLKSRLSARTWRRWRWPKEKLLRGRRSLRSRSRWKWRHGRRTMEIGDNDDDGDGNGADNRVHDSLNSSWANFNAHDNSQILILLNRLKIADARAEYGEMNITKLNQRIDNIEDDIIRAKVCSCPWFKLASGIWKI